MKLVIFDLDGTLAESKQAITGAMPELLSRLLEQKNVAVISGGKLEQLQKQVANQLLDSVNFKNLYLLPTSGAALYEFRNGEWKKVYEEHISDKDADAIDVAIHAAAEETGIVNFKDQSWGPRIEHRGGQVTFSALGQQAPVAIKKTWDPEHKKRAGLVDYLTPRLKDFSVHFGGLTTIDITKKGIDKAYGIHKLCTRLNIPETDTLYVGDELGKGGNDEAVFKTEVKTEAVTGPAQTEKLISLLLNRA